MEDETRSGPRTLAQVLRSAVGAIDALATMIENAVSRSKLQAIPMAAGVLDLSFTRTIRAELAGAIAKLEGVDGATPRPSSKTADVLIPRASVTIDLLLLKVADAPFWRSPKRS